MNATPILTLLSFLKSKSSYIDATINICITIKFMPNLIFKVLITFDFPQLFITAIFAIETFYNGSQNFCQAVPSVSPLSNYMEIVLTYHWKLLKSTSWQFLSCLLFSKANHHLYNQHSQNIFYVAYCNSSHLILN